ncbi:hypothetical protein H632_c2545p1 [Helicosporidium sp. ATCC 50920]|nr:hypothetical protein H632_c2545p1 [Helicosporidium sp. ATCC 50920]|eukprot:KDD73093.1 hypothetical protein H632_c2545p1 [Helicosporidium sp. ATCC 50920]
MDCSRWGSSYAGVLHEEAGSRAHGVAFCRNEAFARAGQGGQEEEEAGADGADGAEEQTLATLEPFIIGMLTNFDALPLDRIHNMLKMFATDPPYESSIDQLSGYMKTLQLREVVAFEGGVYKRK